jgi:thioredoxin 2
MAVVKCRKCGANNRLIEGVAADRQPVCGKCGEVLPPASDQPTTDGKPRTVTDASFAGELARADGVPVLVDCWAPWCGPCRMIAPVLDQLAAESGGRFIIGKLNVDENPQTASQYGIQSIPTMLIFKNGKLVDRLVGLQPKQAIAAKLESHA